MTHTSVNKNGKLPAYRVGKPPNNTLSSRQPSKKSQMILVQQNHKTYDQNATSLAIVNKSHDFCSLFRKNSLNLPRWSPGYSTKSKVMLCTPTQRSRPNKQIFSQRHRRLLLPSTPESNASFLPINKTLDLSTIV